MEQKMWPFLPSSSPIRSSTELYTTQLPPPPLQSSSIVPTVEDTDGYKGRIQYYRRLLGLLATAMGMGMGWFGVGERLGFVDGAVRAGAKRQQKRRTEYSHY